MQATDSGHWGLLPTHATDFRPDLEFLGPGNSLLGGSEVIAAKVEEVIDLIVGREEALRLTGRFELLHLPLSSACRLVRILRSVIESLVLAMLNAGHDLPLCRAVAGKLVGDHDTGRPHLPLQQLAQEPLGGLLVASALDQDVEHDAGLVHGSPKPMLYPGNFEHDLASRARESHPHALPEPYVTLSSHTAPDVRPFACRKRQ